MKFFKSIFLIFLSFGFVVNSFPDNNVRRQLGLFDEIENEISDMRGEIGYVRGNLSVLNETVYDHYTELLEDIALNYNNINENYESIKDNSIAIGVNENNYEIVRLLIENNNSQVYLPSMLNARDMTRRRQCGGVSVLRLTAIASL